MSKTNTVKVSTKATVKPSQLIEILKYCDQANLVPFVLSPPGLGKSSIGRQYSMMRSGDPSKYKPVYLGQLAPTDLCGFPYIDRENNKMRFSVPALLPSEPNSTLHLDELPNAPKQNQNVALQVSLERRVGEWVAPENTFIILSGNSQSDRCHVEKLSSALANRVMFINLVPDLDDWCEWALDNGVDVRVIAFLRFRPDLLHSFDPQKWDGEGGFASPRSWEAASRLIQKDPPASVRVPMLEGILGAGPAAEFGAFLDTYEQLPSIDAILLDPSGAEVPETPSPRYAVCAALSQRVTGKNFGRILAYLDRLPMEFTTFGVRLAYKLKRSEVTSTKDFIKWATDHKDVLL
jgi:hypothetical protein